MQLRIGEEYVKQFGKLAQAGTTLVVPANLTDLASIVTMATSIARKPRRQAPPARPVSQRLTILSSRRARPSIGFLEFVVLAAAMMSTQAIAIDAMLPAFPTIVGALHVGEREPRAMDRHRLHGRDWAWASCSGALLSDRFGRRPVLLGGWCSTSSRRCCADSTGSFHALLAWRFVHGLAAASVTVTRSVIRDLYSGRHMARVMSLTFVVFLTVPILAPSLGQLILLVAPWRYIFVVCGAFAAIVVAVGAAAAARDAASGIPHDADARPRR